MQIKAILSIAALAGAAIADNGAVVARQAQSSGAVAAPVAPAGSQAAAPSVVNSTPQNQGPQNQNNPQGNQNNQGNNGESQRGPNGEGERGPNGEGERGSNGEGERGSNGEGERGSNGEGEKGPKGPEGPKGEGEKGEGEKGDKGKDDKGKGEWSGKNDKGQVIKIVTYADFTLKAPKPTNFCWNNKCQQFPATTTALVCPCAVTETMSPAVVTTAAPAASTVHSGSEGRSVVYGIVLAAAGFVGMLAL